MNFLPNILSASRFFLALLLFSSLPGIRLFAIAAAAFTDFFDGFLARRFKSASRLGTIIDPLSDKFFVALGLYIFLQEGTLTGAEALLMLSRDAAIFLFGCFLVCTRRLKEYPIQAIFFGKVATSFQFLAFMFLSVGISLPFSLFVLFGLLGALSFFELTYSYWARLQSSAVSSKN